MISTKPTNQHIAEALEELANRLAEQGANPHRVQAYHTAAQTVREATQPLAAMVEAAPENDGMEVLKTLPGIGDSIASRIVGYLETGHLVLLETLRNEFVPEHVFTRVFGIGKELARRIHDQLGIETLEELELAAYDGRLATVEGLGEQRLEALRAQLNVLLSQRSQRRARRLRSPAPPASIRHPSVRLLLAIDAEYRARAARKELRRIAPRRLNPSGSAWLPILNTNRDGWRITALFSNTPRAHELGKTDDWVIIYVERDGYQQQYTVVTETRGTLKGRRVVRGREGECEALHAEAPAAA